MSQYIYKNVLTNNMMITENGESISILQWVQQQIDKSPDKMIRMRFVDIKNVLGSEFENKSYGNIYEGLRRTLLNYGIDVKSGTHKKDDSIILLMFPVQYKHDRCAYRKSSIYENALITNMITTKDGEYLNILEWIKQETNTGRKLTVDISYMRNILGPEFKKKNDDTIYFSLRNILKKHDIIVSQKTQHDGIKIIMKHFQIN